MFGKIFEQLFTGSMIGAGAPVFAVWSYVIANQKPSRNHGSTIELNPRLLAMVIGEQQDVIEKSILFLSDPDPESRSKEKQGRRLVKIGEFLYQVVNGAKYRQIRDEEQRRTQVREAVRRHRDKTSKRVVGDGGQVAAAYRSRESRAVAALERGDEESFDAATSEGIPNPPTDV